MCQQNVKEKPETEDNFKDQGDPARDMGTLHHLCQASYKELVNMSRTQVIKFSPKL